MWAWRLAFAFAVVFVGAILIWELAYVLLLVFSALIVATTIRGCGMLVERYTPLNARWSLVLAIFSIAISIAGFLLLLGGQIGQQFAELADRAPELIDNAGAALGINGLTEQLFQFLPEMLDAATIAGGIGAGLSGAFGIATALLLVVVCGLYLAINPEPYWRGTVRMFPPHLRERADATMRRIAHALALWLAGQVAAMIVIGVAVSIAMLALGMPSALAIGLIAGVLEFIPFIGPILAAVPAILVALPEGMEMVIWVLVVYVLIQQIEGNVLVPLIQRRAVRLPPALGLFAILAFGLLFGPLGILLATPLTVVAMVAVQKLYLEDMLGEKNEDETAK